MTDYKEMLKLLSEEADAEGAVLLENDGMLPLAPGDRLAVFGRGQFVHYKSGTGSGGKVNVEYSTSLYDGLKSLGADVNDEMADVYRTWLADNPYDAGDGWKEPWAQKEMPVSAELAARAAEKSDKAVIIIGRTAGEDQDNINDRGSYLLTDTEYEMIKNVSDAFGAVCVLLNTGNIIDMKWSREIKLSAIMYIWHGGQEGGRAAAELLCGRRFPSGHLADTIAYNIEEYPSYDGFANNDEQVYSEDIYVGYRYFETFAPGAVMYPFGFGRSYTDFDLKISQAECCGDYISIDVRVKNIGRFAGKEVAQVYCGAEGTALSRPVRELVGFAKTDTLQPGEDAELKIDVRLSDIARYDDTGVTGYRSSFVLDAGRYSFFVGTNVRDAAKVIEYEQMQTAVVKQLSPVMQPAGEFLRLTNNNGLPAYETVTPAECSKSEPPADAPYTGDRGIKLADVYYGRASLDEFAAQLGDFDLACLSQGEGMNSPKVRAGTGGAIGGLTLSLQRFGIPAVCVTDGPSGLRFDNGDRATCIPNGTLICCTWNRELARRLYMYEGMEARANDVEALLGPGINIHRLPLCGRNFEYMSEDPLLAGSIAAQICRGLKDGGITATVKHFAANNKEQNRKKINMVISERALREIYLKPFELAVKSGAVDMVMTAYNMINGVFCASNYELNTTVLRGEWDYDGLVMTDWWPNTAKTASGGFDADRIPPVIAQNDVFMVNDSAADTACKMLENAENLRGALFRNAKNILRAVMKMPAFEKSLAGAAEIPQGEERGRGEVFFEIKDARRGMEYEVNAGESADYACAVTYSAQSPDTVQIPVDIFVNGERYVCMLRGTEGARKNKFLQIPLAAGQNIIRTEDFNKMVKIISIMLYNAK